MVAELGMPFKQPAAHLTPAGFSSMQPPPLVASLQHCVLPPSITVHVVSVSVQDRELL